LRWGSQQVESGSNKVLICARMHRTMRGPNCHEIHSLRHEAVAVFARCRRPCNAAPGRRPLRQWRAFSWRRRVACRRWGAHAVCPTEAWAYQVPRRAVPRETPGSEHRSTYSARCSSGTAQSSMNAHRLAVAAFMLIMMLRPGLAHFPQCFLGCVGRSFGTTAVGHSEFTHQIYEVSRVDATEWLARPAPDEFHQQDQRRACQ
jgi:hypothetical protein